MRRARHSLRWRLRREYRKALCSGLVISATITCSLAWYGCTPQQRYHTLSFFFDGVPDPRAASASNADSGNKARLDSRHKPLLHQHKPFADGNCTACHGTDTKTIDVAHVAQICQTCHPGLRTQYPVMHEPVLIGDCLWCHLPHESNEPALLVNSSPRLCIQCHDRNTLSTRPPEHQAEEINCLDCHLGHGGTTHQLLNPTTRPGALSTTRGAS